MKLATACALVTLAIPLHSVRADEAAERGLAIAKEAKSRDTGYQDFIATVTMTLKNKQGQSSVRKMDVKTLEAPGEGEKALIVFSAPADTKGTALLSYSYKDPAKEDDQWLFLPSVKRVKRIASGNKTGSFVGSEFSYEDISPQQVEKYTYKYLRDEVLAKVDCFVVERYPLDAKSGYTKQISWLDKAEYRPYKVELYDRKNTKIKTLLIIGYDQYLGKFWRPKKSYMLNHQTGKSTTLDFEGYQFRTGLKPSDFDQSVLGKLQ